MAVLVEKTDSESPAGASFAEPSPSQTRTPAPTPTLAPAGRVGRLLADLRRSVAAVSVGACGPDELSELTRQVRAGQQALDGLLLRIGMAAERHQEKGRGRGVEGTLLGNGQSVRGSTARREAERVRTASRFGRLAEAVNAGRLGGEHLDVIARATSTLNDEQQQQLASDALIEAASRGPVDFFNRWVRREAERIKGDHGLADTKARQAANNRERPSSGCAEGERGGDFSRQCQSVPISVTPAAVISAIASSSEPSRSMARQPRRSTVTG